MTQDEKLQSLIEWLDKHGIKYVQPTDGEIDNFVRIIIKKPRAVVFTCPAEKEDFCYQAASLARQRAFFIRENDTEDFVVQKMRNCLRGWTSAMALQKEAEALEAKRKEEEAKKKAEEEAKNPPKPKRKRVHFQRVSK